MDQVKAYGKGKADEAGQLAAGMDNLQKRLDELEKQKKIAEARAAMFRTLADKLRAMVDAGQIKVTVRNGRMLLVLPNDILFDSGKTELKPEGKEAIGKVAKVLATMPADRHFLVAGHTDNLPIKTKKFQSNWELSTQRAVEVVRLLIDNGMKPSQVGAAGYAEYDPAADNGSEAGQKQNRRIEWLRSSQEKIEPLVPHECPKISDDKTRQIQFLPHPLHTVEDRRIDSVRDDLRPHGREHPLTMVARGLLLDHRGGPWRV
jgi:chemotaxis protein MotB